MCKRLASKYGDVYRCISIYILVSKPREEGRESVIDVPYAVLSSLRCRIRYRVKEKQKKSEVSQESKLNGEARMMELPHPIVENLNIYIRNQKKKNDIVYIICIIRNVCRKKREKIIIKMNTR